MMSVFKNLTEFRLTKEIRLRIEREIDILSSIKNSIYFKVKEFELGFYINFIVNTTSLDLNIKEKNIPEYITFLVIIDYSYPIQAPKILSKTNFSFPNLMDGRDLSLNILPYWKPELTLLDIANSFPIFLKKFLTTNAYYYYGEFTIGAVYDLKNFNNLLVNTFTCLFDPSIQNDKSLMQKEDDEFILILTDDTFLLFQHFENNKMAGKLIFWATLFSIIDIQINKQNKIVSIHMYSEEKTIEKTLCLQIQNVLFFREALVKRMSNLKVKIESMRTIKGQQLERRLTSPEINAMNIVEIEHHLKYLENKIQRNELSFYIVNTYSILCGKAIEYYSSIESDKHIEILSSMKKILSKEEVKRITIDQ